MNLINIYYELSEIFNDDIEMLVVALHSLTNTKYKRSDIRDKLECLNLNTIEYELNQLYDISIITLIKFRENRVSIFEDLENED